MASKKIEKQKSVRLSIDDTIPLICVVESGEKIQDHVVIKNLSNFIFLEIIPDQKC